MFSHRNLTSEGERKGKRETRTIIVIRFASIRRPTYRRYARKQLRERAVVRIPRGLTNPIKISRRDAQGDTRETALVIFPVQHVRASSLHVRVIASNAFLLRALTSLLSFLEPSCRRHGKRRSALRSFALIINVPAN